MPGRSGKVLAAAITERRPETKVLFMSGYSYNVIVHQGILDDGVTLLEKPFSAQMLLQSVRDVIERCDEPAGEPSDPAGERTPGPTG
jgi:FixJ family two-component response regulator